MASTAITTIDQNKSLAQQAIGKLKAFFESNSELTVLSNQTESLCTQADEILTKDGRIVSAADYTEAGEIVVSLSAVTDQIAEILDPYTTQRKLFNSAMIQIEKSYLEPGEESRKVLKRAMGSFEIEAERQRRAQEAIAAAAAKAQQEADAMAEAQRLQDEGMTEEAAQVVQDAIEAPPPVVVTPKTYTKASGVTLRMSWKWSFDGDIVALPEADLRKLVSLLIVKNNDDGTVKEVSLSGINSLVSKFQTKATAQVPGIKVWSVKG